MDSSRSFSISASRLFSSFFDAGSSLRRLNSFVSITTPFMPGGAFRDASFTSPALSPKMARRSFSSGVGSVSPFGVIFPTMMSPALTSAPTRMIPRSSRSLVASSETFGISRVSSSSPRFVSRTWSSNSSMWTDVYTSSDTKRSEMTMASSKLYPRHGINATSTFFPRANSPLSVEKPSVNTVSFLTRSPTLTIGL